MKVGKDIYYVLYVMLILIAAVIYFTMPEREAFLNYQIQWWSELWDVIRPGTGNR